MLPSTAWPNPGSADKTGSESRPTAVVDPDASVRTNVRDRVLSKGPFLYDEPEFFLRQELREPGTYMAILEAMATGKTTVTEIANAIDRDASTLSRYLKNLTRLEVVERLVPVTEPNRKQGRCAIADNFFEFWFRFASPNSATLERGNAEAVTSAAMNELADHTSRRFEDVCRQAVGQPNFPVSASRIGTWWYGEEEIDVAAVDEQDGRLILGECKWTTAPVDVGLLRDLERTASAVRWRGDDRIERFVLFSKSGFTDDLESIVADRDDVLLYDLPALAALFGIDRYPGDTDAH